MDDYALRGSVKAREKRVDIRLSKFRMHTVICLYAYKIEFVCIHFPICMHTIIARFASLLYSPYIQKLNQTQMLLQQFPRGDKKISGKMVSRGRSSDILLGEQSDNTIRGCALYTDQGDILLGKQSDNTIRGCAVYAD